MSRNLKIFFASAILSIPVWLILNIGSFRLTEQFTAYFFESPEFLKAQAFTNQLQGELVAERPLLKHSSNPLVLQGQIASSAFLRKDGSQKQLYAHNSTTQAPIASITKLMVALVVLEEFQLKEPIAITQHAIAQEGEAGNFQVGDTFSARDLLYPLLIESSNDAAAAFAQHIGEKQFIERMNIKARALGLSDTLFINPTGLDEVEQGQWKLNTSSARDLTILASYLLHNTPELFDILSQKEFVLRRQDNTYHHTLYTTNAFLDYPAWEGRILGGKTGWTEFAQGSLLLVFEDPQKNGYVVNVILQSKDRFGDMRKLTEWIQQSYAW